MTPEQFCIWLDGFMDGNDLMDADLKEKLRDKMGGINVRGAEVKISGPTKRDVPLTRDMDDSFRSPPVITGGLGVARGGAFTGGTVGLVQPEPYYTLTANAAIDPNAAPYDARLSAGTIVATDPVLSAASMAALSKAARACE